jgi:hypothetical protein
MNLSVLVGSCDKYEFIWEQFFVLFDRYWDHSMDIKKYFLVGEKDIPSNSFINLKSKTNDWCDSVLYALDNIDTDYVLWLQDDYFLQKQINYIKFKKYLSFINDNHILRFGIYQHNPDYNYSININNIFRLSQNSCYTISMQASIWNKDFLKGSIIYFQNYCLNFKLDPNQWNFEIYGTSILNRLIENHRICIDIQSKPWYLEALKQGKYTFDYYNICKREKLIGEKI